MHSKMLHLHLLAKWCFILSQILLAQYALSGTGQINLALHKSYTLSPRPTYPFCTDKSDVTQLTDGEKRGSDWIKKSTVGWLRISRLVEVTIDLDKPVKVSEVNVHSMGGGFASVNYPEFITVFVSMDGKQFQFAGLSGGRLMNKNVPAKKKIPRVFRLKDIEKYAQFVKILMRADGRYMFLDEVEVLSSIHPAQTAYRSEMAFDHDKLSEVFIAVDNQLNLKNKIQHTKKTVMQHRQMFAKDLFNDIVSNLAGLEDEISEPEDKLFWRRSLETYSKQLSSIRSKIYKEVYKEPYMVLPANPMEILYQEEMLLSPEKRLGTVSLHAWQGEYEPVALNVINCTDHSIELSVHISPLRNNQGYDVDSTNVFNIRRAVFVNAKGLGSIADPLVLCNNKPFVLPCGEITQIWLTIKCNLDPGVYKASVAVIADTPGTDETVVKTVPISITVEPIEFPEHTALKASVWAYPEQIEVTKHSLNEVAEDLARHYTNVFVIHPASVPWPAKKAVIGAPFVRPRFAKLDKVLQINKFAQVYLLYLEFSHEWTRSYFGEWMSLSWKRNFSAWLQAVVNHLRRMDIGYSRFAVYPYDEKLGKDFYQLAKLIKKTDPRIKIFANSFGKGPSDFMPLKQLVDIWDLPDRKCLQNPDWFEMINGFHKEIWVYDAKGPGKANEPYSYYRLLPWRAFNRGQTGAGFWVYIDEVDRQCWHDSDRPGGYYAVIYGAAESLIAAPGEYIIPSRRWQAWREGIEDYEYLYQLKTAIERARTANPQKAALAEKILNQQVKHVLEQSEDCQVVYEARRRLNDALLLLGGMQN